MHAPRLCRTPSRASLPRRNTSFSIIRSELPSRCFSQSSRFASGHNRWSKIKHDKAKADASINRQRSALSHEIATASRLHGPDPRFNPSLFTILASAKKTGFPKHLIQNAIARGQGVSPSGNVLESVVIEAMIPLRKGDNSVAAIIECQTDSKAKTIMDLKLLVKKHGGVAMPTSHMFEKKGRVVFANPGGLKEEDIFDVAVEAGASDIEVTEENEVGKIEVRTEPKETVVVVEEIEEKLNLKRERVEIFWEAKEDMIVNAGEGKAESLDSFMGRLLLSAVLEESRLTIWCVEQIWEEPSVQDVYLNIA
ncbi:uncharacterized protein KY384_003564 [Bacidia gigantensis]|uniref:uncharacterized protein n=1 Tax=Bacidia gigantensis TaxID=2732470 RepID=UPI001D04BD51|nr:uncharacterized protein KY384_003564 [Bacidia gigantensis]KAG8531928.1 hypothetical protein KY384_003564 [Bacidia gigantensis]